MAEMVVAADTGQKLRSALELGTVATIFILLASLALQNFETFIVRGQLAEAFNMTSTVRAELVVYRAEHGHWPANAEALDNPALRQAGGLGTFADRLVLDKDGSLSTFFGASKSASPLSGRQLTLRPMLVAGSPGSPVFWACAAYGAPAGFVASGEDNTDIELRYLPAICRDY